MTSMTPLYVSEPKEVVGSLRMVILSTEALRNAQEHDSSLLEEAVSKPWSAPS
jgi:hypothetical protein